MKLLTVLISLIIFVPGTGATPFSPPRITNSTEGERAWLIRASYNRQAEMNFFEAGIGRMNSLYSVPDPVNDAHRAASIGFTMGIDCSNSDTSFILAPKLGIEAALTVFGARISYGYYRQENNSTGVIGMEGGINILSVFFVYVGYNFVKSNNENPVIESGPKFSVGLNLPLFAQPIPSVKRLGKD